MKHIPRIPLDGARILTPSEMNGIHFETGLHTPTSPRNANTLHEASGATNLEASRPVK